MGARFLVINLSPSTLQTKVRAEFSFQPSKGKDVACLHI